MCSIPWTTYARIVGHSATRVPTASPGRTVLADLDHSHPNSTDLSRVSNADSNSASVLCRTRTTHDALQLLYSRSKSWSTRTTRGGAASRYANRYPAAVVVPPAAGTTVASATTAPVTGFPSTVT
jgi:hypothetical protein